MPHYALLDARGLLLRDYHGTTYKSLALQDGTMIPSWQDGLAAFCDRTLFPLLQQNAPRQVIACFDGGNNYRRALFPPYKQHRRDKVTDPLSSQQQDLLMEKGRRLLAYFGVKTVHVPGEEADDLVALFCQRLVADSLIVHTRDADLFQLAAGRVSVLYDGLLYGDQPFMQQEHKGVPLRFIRLNKSIVGDSSDGYPGVRGAGPKFWESLLEFGEDGLEELEAIVSGGMKDRLKGTGDAKLDKLHTQWDEWNLSHALASLHPEACYGQFKAGPKRPEWTVRVPNRKKVDEILDEAKIQLLPVLAGHFPTERLITADQHEELQRLMPEILSSEIVSYDFESSDKLQHPAFQEARKGYVDVLSQEIAGISVNYGRNLQHTVYVPFDHAGTACFGKDWAKWLLLSLDTRADRAVVQNANFELSVAKTDLGVDLRAPYDTKIMASYVDENEEAGLKAASLGWLRYQQASYKEVTGGRAMWELTGDEVLSYGCDDSLVTSHLFDVKRIIMQIEGSWDFFCRYEVDPVKDDVAVFIDGTDIDFVKMNELRVDAADRVAQAQAGIHVALSQYAVTGDESEIAVCATALLQEWWATDQYKTAYQNDPEKAKAGYASLWKKAWDGCFYRAPVAAPVKAFQVTPSQVSKLIGILDGAAPQIKKLTVASIEEWDLEMSEYLGGVEKGLRGQMKDGAIDHAVVQRFDDLKELQVRLFAARKDVAPSKRTGMAFDRLVFHCEETLERLHPSVQKVSGDSLNFASSPQMQMLLYGKLRLPIRRRSKVTRGTLRDKKGLKGPPATGLKAIATALVHDVILEDDWRMAVLENYKTISLLQQEESLYYKTYPLYAHPRDGKLHPQFINCGTATRRPTGTSPNDLQVSKKDGAKIRKCYVGGEYGDGPRVYVAMDFANQEMLITAVASQDPVMLGAFTSSPRRDLHSLTATGFAHLLLPRLGVTGYGQFSYEDFMAGRKSEDEKLAKALNEVRNKYAKACIAEGSLVLTDRGLVPIELVLLTDKVWDGVEWVSHAGVICKGTRYVVSFDGLTATPDHEVYTDDGRKVPFGDLIAETRRSCLAVGAIGETPATYSGSGLGDLLEKREGPHNHAVYGLLRGEGEGCCKHALRGVEKLLELPQQVEISGSEASRKTVLGLQVSLRSSWYKGLQVLRRAWHTAEVFVSRRVCVMGYGELAPSYIPGGGHRPHRQQRSLRAWELTAGEQKGKLRKQERHGFCRLLRSGCPDNARLALAEDGLPRDDLQGHMGAQDAVRRSVRGTDPGKVQNTEERLARVYDLVNAGPRHRFTVSGRIVSNCNFLILYMGGHTTLAENLQIPEDLAKEIMANTFSTYPRLQPWQQETSDFARAHGYVETVYGNRRHATKDLYSGEKGLVKRQERQLSNFCIQSTAADILKIVRQAMFEQDFRSRFRMKAVKPVYDEVSASVPLELARDYALALAGVMQVTPPGYPVPMPVELAIGKTWGDVKEVALNAEAIDSLLLGLTN